MRLKKLPATDLNAKFALILDNGMIKHYTVPMINVMTSTADRSIEDLVIEDIRNEGVVGPIEVVAPDHQFAVSETVQALTADTFSAMLTNKARKNLFANKSQSMLYIYLKDVPFTGLLSFTNLKLLLDSPKVHALWESIDNFCHKPIEDGEIYFYQRDYKSPFHKLLYSAARGLWTLLGNLAEEHTVRAYAPAFFFAIRFEENQIDKAIEALSNDINLLCKKFKVMGNFYTAKLFPLSNSVGNDKKILAITCAPFVDTSNLMKNGSYDELFNKVKSVGLKYFVHEGSSLPLDGKEPYSNLILGTAKHVTTPVVFVDDSDPMDGFEPIPGVNQRPRFDLKKDVETLQKALDDQGIEVTKTDIIVDKKE